MTAQDGLVDSIHSSIRSSVLRSDSSEVDNQELFLTQQLTQELMDSGTSSLNENDSGRRYDTPNGGDDDINHSQSGRSSSSSEGLAQRIATGQLLHSNSESRSQSENDSGANVFDNNNGSINYGHMVDTDSSQNSDTSNRKADSSIQSQIESHSVAHSSNRDRLLFPDESNSIFEEKIDNFRRRSLKMAFFTIKTQELEGFQGWDFLRIHKLRIQQMNYLDQVCHLNKIILLAIILLIKKSLVHLKTMTANMKY